MVKGLILTAAAVMAAGEAQASKARMTALGQNVNIGSQYIMDSRNVFHNPAYVAGMGGMFQVEFGQSDVAPGQTGIPENAEGGFFQKAGEGTFGLWLGHGSPTASALRAGATAIVQDAPFNETGAFLTPQNSVEFFYGGSGSLDWGVSVQYSAAANTETALNAAENSVGLRGGVSTDTWDVGLVLGVANTATFEEGGDEYKFLGTMGALLTAGYKFDEQSKVFFNYQMGGNTLEAAGAAEDAAKVELANLGLGYARNWAMDKGLFFYSIEYRSLARTVGGGDASTRAFLPLIIGVETEATSWLVLRGSIQQSVFLDGTTKGSATTAGVDTTVASVGAGLNFEGLMIDGVLSSGKTGDFSFGQITGGAPMMAQVSMTYNF